MNVQEKMTVYGSSVLSDKELISTVVRSDLASQILTVLDKNNSPTIKDLTAIKGIGQKTATILMAMAEFYKRRIRPEGYKITSPSDIMPLIQHYGDRKQEHFICVSLNGANEVIATRVVTIGLVNQTQVHPREVFADPITDRATSVIIAHNHPSGRLWPSQEDLQVTQILKKSGELLGIAVLDHLIFGRSGTGYYSLMEHGEL